MSSFIMSERSCSMNLFGFNKPQIYTPVKTLIFQSPKKFEQAIKGYTEVSPFPQYSIHAVAAADAKYTKNANTCAILAMSNGKRTYLGHYAPEYKSSKFKSQLEHDVKKMQDETGELSAIITGGMDKDITNGTGGLLSSQVKDSYTQLAEIGEVLDKANANLTMISAKILPSFKEHLAVTPDKFIITHSPNSINSKIPKLSSYPNTNEFEKELNNYYSIVEIDPAHKIYYEG